MPRGEIYRAVKGAFVYLYLYLVILGLTALAAALWEEGTARLLLALVAADFAAVLLAKRKLILDLLEGRTETFRGRIHHCENAGSLRSVSVIYLVEDGNESPRRFVCFPDAVPVSPEKMGELSSGSAVLWYLPRSLAVVGSAPPYKGVVPAEALAGGGIQKAQLCCALPPAAGALLVL